MELQLNLMNSQLEVVFLGTLFVMLMGVSLILTPRNGISSILIDVPEKGPVQGFDVFIGTRFAIKGS